MVWVVGNEIYCENDAEGVFMLANFLRKQVSSGKSLLRLMNWYSPFVGARIRIAEMSEDFRYVLVEMPLTWYNANYVGVHFGGSMYMMTDPFFMLMYLKNLGDRYVVWDQAAKIEFIKPGRKKLQAEFRITAKDIKRVKVAAASGRKYLFDQEVMIRDESGDVVARVTKTLYVRRKDLASKR